MPVIIVNSPFALRLSSKHPRRNFPPGEHAVSEEELAHWFMQGCIKDGRAILKSGGAVAGNGDAEAPAFDEAALKKMKRDELEALAVSLGLDTSGLPNKDSIVALILGMRTAGTDNGQGGGWALP